jgi:hypothetical protein
MQDLKNRLQSQNPTQSHKPEQREREAHMRLNSSAQLRKGALTAGLQLRSEAEVRADLHIHSAQRALSSPQHTDLHKTLDTSPTARCPTLPKKPLTSPSSQGLHNPTKK